jgi:hypothetical protein
MEVLCWRNTERLDQVMVEALLARAEVSLEAVKPEAVRLAKQVVDSCVEVR